MSLPAAVRLPLSFLSLFTTLTLGAAWAQADEQQDVAKGRWQGMAAMANRMVVFIMRSSVLLTATSDKWAAGAKAPHPELPGPALSNPSAPLPQSPQPGRRG